MPIEQALTNFDIRRLILALATNRGAQIRHLIFLCVRSLRFARSQIGGNDVCRCGIIAQVDARSL
jgi:hypothetical protein